MNLLDNPLILSMVFYPRTAAPGRHNPPHINDGIIPVAGDVVLGYRLYIHQPDSPLILYFHGNAEVASDYDDIATLYHRIGASLLVVDYRGYGWSTGSPLVSALLSDTEAIHQALPDILKNGGLSNPPLYIMGRSLGSISAIQIAHQHPDSFKGIILESGISQVVHVLLRWGFPANLLQGLDPVGNFRKIAEINLPLLVIHGELDQIVPVSHGQELYDLSPTQHKQILRVFNAGHNDLLYRNAEAYFAAIADFLTAHSA
jgi:hypothetical protein